MITSVASQKCWNHSSREAVARCPECGHSYCRECVIEHDDRLICAGCLARLTTPSAKPRHRVSLVPVLRVGGTMVGLVIAWFMFFGIGRMLLSIPDSFHADRLWYRALGEALGESGP